MAESIVAVAEDPCHALIYEDEDVRVYRVEIRPQQATLLHRHTADYISLIVASGQVDDCSPGTSPKRIHYQAGEVRTSPAGRVHQVRNVGELPFRTLVIEFKAAVLGE